MRLPQPLIESPFFSLSSLEEVSSTLARSPALDEIEQIRLLAEKGLPPVTSVDAIAAMIGVNPGIIWSFVHRPHKHYRIFDIQKGKKTRKISSPRVGLKIIQKWIGFHLSRAAPLPPHVFGFVPGKSHIDAAFEHRSADWAYSVDIVNFFGATPVISVATSLERLGYTRLGAELITRLNTLNGFLTQGSPASPVLSNLAFLGMDAKLSAIATRFDARLSRYADDIVFSGFGPLPVGLAEAVHGAFADGPWSLAPEKERIEPLKGRVKVHGLIVNGDHVRLTKGYRNKLRAYRYILAKAGGVENLNSLQGHIKYSEHVTRRLDLLSRNPPVHSPFEYPTEREQIKAQAPSPQKKPSPLIRIAHRVARIFDQV